jgi:hypothetical protein
MSSFDVHIKKYRMFLKDAENKENSHPTRIEAYFESVFHLIEAVAAKDRMHVNKHQLLRNVLEENDTIFGGETENVWKAFQEIENQIRPGQIYGGSINGKALERAKKLFERIRGICGGKLEI